MAGVAKHVVLTGATSGIGKRLLTRLLAGGSPDDQLRVIIPTRSMDLAKQLFGSSPCVVPVACDLANLESVKQAARDITRQCPKGAIDVLILNAGIMNSAVRHTASGYEETLACNHLGHILLLHELLPLLLKADAPRVVLVGSELHKSVPWPASAATGGPGAATGRGRGAAVAWEPEQALFQLSAACRGKLPGLPDAPPAPFSGRMAYNVSKLYNLWTARVLARRAGDKLWAACVSPGFVPTAPRDPSSSTDPLWSWGPWGQWAARNVLRLLPFAVSEEEGVERVWQVAFGPLPPPTTAATSPDAGAGAPSGGYWARRKLDPGSELSQDLVRAQRMWDYSMQALGLTDFLGPVGANNP